jgi:circadian clock protein KaiC
VSEQRQAPRVAIPKLATGVPGLDEILGGGLPEFSFNLIAGAPGTGKTTLAQQIMFANATPERPALHFTVLGEPPLKLLRYQQQFEFFDPGRVGVDIRLLNLSEEVMERDLDAVLERIAVEVERANPGIVVVDSFRTVLRSADMRGPGETALQHFVQRLGVHLTSWEATTFLIGEYEQMEIHNPIFTVADGIVWLFNEAERHSSVRKLRVTKMRGQETMPGLHTLRISRRGVECYPRLPKPGVVRAQRPVRPRLATGVPGLDELMGGGIPVGDSALVTGPTGSGKTILAMQFIAEGVRAGETGVIAVFEEHPQSYVERAKSLGFELEEMVRSGRLEIVYLRPLDLSVDETLQEIRERVQRLSAARVIIDSLSGFEVALAPSFRQDFRESFYRLIGALTALDVTVLSTMELAESNTSVHFTPYSISFLTDDVIAQRYVELKGQLRRVLSVIKMRSSEHSRDFRLYDVTSRGLVVGQRLAGYRGITTGVPEPHDGAGQPPDSEPRPESGSRLAPG